MTEIPLPSRPDVEFRQVPLYPAYVVGSDGTMWTRRLRGSKTGTLRDEWRQCEVSPNKDGYTRVSLTNKDGAWRIRLHQLVLEVFVGPCPEGYEGCHKNDIKTDNRLENLYWGTRLDNVQDCIRNGNTCRGERHRHAKLNNEKAKTIRDEYLAGETIYTLAERYQVSVASIGQVIRGDTWKVEGYERPTYKNTAKGDNHGRAKLDWNKVEEIRALYKSSDVTKAALARQFKVGKTTITRVVNETHWKR